MDQLIIEGIYTRDKINYVLATNNNVLTYGKEDIETGMLIPYKDAELTQKLESRYWVRPAQEDGTPSFDYLLTCHRYEWDCTVSYSGVEYKKMLRNDASVPDDVETKFYVLPNNYNVYYFDDMP